MNKITELQSIKNIEPYNLLKTLGITQAPVDVFEIAKSIGANVDQSYDFEKLSFSGEVFLNQDHKPVIWVNPIDSTNRQRFTMAHELAHLVNDIIPNIGKENENNKFHVTSNSLKRDGRQESIEFRANEFAAQLLMPAEFISVEASKIINTYKSIHGEKSKIPKDDFITQISEVFEVSNQAMTIRLTRLGII